jgi:glutathione synthase/RimK-type ligase-like ATP-grasp enzyme
MNIGFITSENYPLLIDSEKAFAAYAKDYGINIKPVIWTEENDYSEFDFLIMRTPWDYFIKFDEFRIWLDEIEASDIKIWNPMNVMRNNIHKFYLSSLSREGVEILPTVFIKQGTAVNITGEMINNGWNKAVIKPAVSGGAYNTRIIDLRIDGHDEIFYNELVKNNDVLLQKFSEVVINEGEWSLVFFNKKYSHSVLKKPAGNDFRVQAEYGGKSLFIEAPAYLIEQAAEIINKIDDELLYARVDGIDNNGRLQLMELELIEPDLFLETETAKKNFLETILLLNKSH